ncbi:MAG: polysaccharide deacetylase family protein [Spirochaetales bacterium]|nr:polysaccharide deacetylase family protein [Spirochaetales bacterium]
MTGLFKLALTLVILANTNNLDYTTDTQPIINVSTSEKVLFLTIDDGNDPDPRLIDFLLNSKIRGTAFINGNIIDKNIEWIKALSAADWDIAGHSYNHKALTTMSETELKIDTIYTSTAIFLATGQFNFFLRPPYGIYNSTTSAILAGQGYKIINFERQNSTADFIDSIKLETKWSRIDNFLEKAQGGEIILAHFGAKDSYQTVKYTVEQALAQGFRFEKISNYIKK